MPLESRTRATLRRAEFGFFGVMILTCRQTPFFCGQPCMAGCLGLLRCGTRGLRTSWLIVGILVVARCPGVVRGRFVPIGRCVKLVVGGRLVKVFTKNRGE